MTVCAAAHCRALHSAPVTQSLTPGEGSEYKLHILKHSVPYKLFHLSRVRCEIPLFQGLAWKTAGSKYASRKGACINLCQPVKGGLSLLLKHML